MQGYKFESKLSNYLLMQYHGQARDMQGYKFESKLSNYLLMQYHR